MKRLGKIRENAPLGHRRKSTKSVPNGMGSLPNGRGLKPPPLVLQAKTAPPQRKPKPAKKEFLPFSNMGSVALLEAAKCTNDYFQDKSVHIVSRRKYAKDLLIMYRILNSRSTPHLHDRLMGRKPRNRHDDIWKIYRGFGDPMIGDLESVSPFGHYNEWKEAVMHHDPASWSGLNVHEGYTKRKGKANIMRGEDPSGKGDVERVEKMIGKESLLPELKSAAEWGTGEDGKLKKSIERNPDFDLSVADMVEIMKKINPRLKGVFYGPGNTKMISFDSKIFKDAMAKYINEIKKAFDLAHIDTIQAQAAYLAHGAGETKFSILTEGQSNPYEDDNAKKTYRRDAQGPLGYASDGDEQLKSNRDTVDPLDRIHSYKAAKFKSDEEVREILDDTYIGRGPIQVTNDFGYTKTLIYLQKLAESTPDPKKADKIWEAVYEIKKDPSAAAKPEYTFLFSAAYMHASGGMRRTSRLGKGMGQIKEGVEMTDPQKDLINWVSGGGDLGVMVKEGRLDKHFMDAANSKIRAYSLFFEKLKANRNAKQKLASSSSGQRP